MCTTLTVKSYCDFEKSIDEASGFINLGAPAGTNLEPVGLVPAAYGWQQFRLVIGRPYLPQVSLK